MDRSNLKSWVESANHPRTDFPIQNLPYGVFRTSGDPRIGVAIGDQILDLRLCAGDGFLDSLAPGTVESCNAVSLNALMARGSDEWHALRARITDLLRADVAPSKRPSLVPMTGATMEMPASIGDYTDFYACIYHAMNVGSLFRPDNPMLPNYKYIPIGYHGRASSIVLSGTDVHRPNGQSKDAGWDEPRFGPSRAMDYELEVGFFAGPGNPQAAPISIEDAESHLFGACLLNDWSARDIQAWEYQPLGPFLGKSFATTISPWIVTMESLEPFRLPAFARATGDPKPMPYLYSDENERRGGIDITLEIFLASSAMRAAGMEAVQLCRGSFRDLYWTMAQMITHHTSNGCNLRPGDLIGSGTVSGATPESLGSMLELTRRGTDPVELPTGEKRKFIEDGDEIVMRGYCERDGHARIGFGECRGRLVVPPR